MKATLTVFILLTLISLNTFAQDSPQWGLPDDAIARLGKGVISGNLAYSPDGSRLAVASGIGVWVYDTTTYEAVFLLSGHTQEVTSIAFSLDGNTIASADGNWEEDNLRLWDAVTGEEKFALAGGFLEYGDIAFSPDGNTLASTDFRGIRLWDTDTGEEKRVIKTGDSIASLAFSPDGETLASGGWLQDGTIRLWDVETGTEKLEITEGSDSADHLAFSLDGTMIASAGGLFDTNIYLWDAATGELKQTLMGEDFGEVTSIAFSRDSMTLASSGGFLDSDIRLWDVDTGQQKGSLTGHTSDVVGLAFSPDEATLASGSRDGSIRFWDFAEAAEKASITGHTSGINRIAFSPDGGTLVSVNYHTVNLWDAATGEYRNTVTEEGFIWRAGLSGDGDTFAIDDYDNSIRLLDVSTGDTKIKLTGHTDSVNAIAISLDGNTVAGATGPLFGDGEHTIFIWDAVTGELKYELSGHTGAIDVLAFSPDGEMLASGSEDSTVRIWNTAAGVQVFAFERHSEAITSLAFSADGNTLASGSMDGTVRLWNIATAENQHTLSVDAIWPESVAFGFDEGTFAAGTYDNTVELWDSMTGDRRAVLEGHRGSVNALAFNPVNGRLASGSDDGTVLLWNITVETEVEVVKGDVNQDGEVNILDLVLVATRIGQTGPNAADANGDGNVNILDLVLVAGEIGNAAAAPSFHSEGMAMLSPSEVKQWLEEARGLGLEDATLRRGIRFLESLLAAFTPIDTALLPNYPNPFNPETWIPYRLAADSEVHISIFDSKGVLVRQLNLGRQPAGHYIDRGRAAYWDGRNEHAETVASGAYFYQLHAADYSHIRRMVVVK